MLSLIIEKINIGSEEPTLCTINHLAGSIKNTKDKNKGFEVSLKSFTKKQNAIIDKIVKSKEVNSMDFKNPRNGANIAIATEYPGKCEGK